MKSTNPKDRIGVTKPPLHLIPASALIHESMAMKNGAAKYGPFNWRGESVAASVYVSAAMRHISSWYDGENDAKDSNVNHLAHARACLGIILDAESVGKLVDDRPPKGAAAELLEKFTEKEKVLPPTDLSEHDMRWRGEPPVRGKTRCYISGPMRGLPDNNFPAFDAVRDRLLHGGFSVVSPADMDREVGFGTVIDYAKRDCSAIIDLAQNNPTGNNMLILLDGWSKSRGARAEVFLAKWLGLKIRNQNGGPVNVGAGPMIDLADGVRE